MALGNVSLTLAVQVLSKGQRVPGTDLDGDLVEMVNRGEVPFPQEADRPDRFKDVVASEQTTAAIAATASPKGLPGCPTRIRAASSDNSHWRNAPAPARPHRRPGTDTTASSLKVRPRPRPDAPTWTNPLPSLSHGRWLRPTVPTLQDGHQRPRSKFGSTRERASTCRRHGCIPTAAQKSAETSVMSLGTPRGPATREPGNPRFPRRCHPTPVRALGSRST